MKKLEELIWNNEGIIKADDEKNGEGGGRVMTINCLMICCGSNNPPAPKSFLGCK